MEDGCLLLRMNLHLSYQNLLRLILHSQRWIDFFMIILLLNLGPDFENIQEQILTRAVIQNFDEALAWLLCHTSTVTQSIRIEITSDTSVMVSQSHSRSDSRGGRCSNQG